MSHFWATYIDLIQSIGFTSLLVIVIFITRKLFLDNKKDFYINAVKIEVDD